MLYIINTRPQVRYNNANTKTRAIIERCFVWRKKRFKVLHGEIRTRPDSAVKTIMACAVLHNITLHQPNEPEIPIIPVNMQDSRHINQVHQPGGKAKYRTYSPTALTRAYSAIMVDKLSINRASKSYGVPFQTLRDRVTGNVDPECFTMDNALFFTLDEESQLVIHLKEMAQLGYGYNRQEIVDIATDYAVMLDKKTKNDKPLTLTWFYGMLGRWPDLKVVKPRALEVARAKAANKENITKYFNELEKSLLKYDLMDKPHLIYNVDEKGVTINRNPSKVVSGVETSSQEVTSGKGDTVPILGCGNATGNTLPLTLSSQDRE
ncbi:unnamed protein product [Mytilus coruscus]|uniref:DDE Tnp4 domain-containing protein n=1 Tax=Mytilus coruscus TaxID=42192 RepID=A0A6J8C0H5_MYTCO|nr:unnamed protein product [Mytilus coruscus]